MGICMNAKEIKDKFRKYFMVLLLVFCSAFVVTNYKTTTVQAASTSTMKKAYTNYVRKNRWFIYGKRSEHGDLLEKLKEGLGGTLVMKCGTRDAESLKEEMAVLTDYYIW